jgi:hypothetical protein
LADCLRFACFLVWCSSTGWLLLTRIVAGLQKHAELLESYSTREAAAADYVRAVRPGLEVHTGELHDAKVRFWGIVPVSRLPGGACV